MATERMEQALTRLAEGGSFGQFVEVTQQEWTALAKRVLRRTCYAPMELDDVRQVMLVAAWQAIANYEPERSNIGSFVIWHAVNEATRAVNRAKGLRGSAAKRGAGKSDPGPFVLNEAQTLVVEDAAPRPDEVADARMRAESFLAHATSRDRVLVSEALAVGSLDGAARRLFNDPSLKLATDIDKARRSIKRAINRTRMRIGGNNGNDKTKEDHSESGEDRRRRANGQGSRAIASQGVSRSGERCRADGRSADAASRRRQARRRRARVESGALVSCDRAG